MPIVKKHKKVKPKAESAEEVKKVVKKKVVKRANVTTRKPVVETNIKSTVEKETEEEKNKDMVENDGYGAEKEIEIKVNLKGRAKKIKDLISDMEKVEPVRVEEDKLSDEKIKIEVATKQDVEVQEDEVSEEDKAIIDRLKKGSEGIKNIISDSIVTSTSREEFPEERGDVDNQASVDRLESVHLVKDLIAKNEETGYVDEDEDDMDEEFEDEDSNGNQINDEVRVNRSIHLYKRIAIFFFVLVVFLVSFVVYSLVVKVDIILIPNQEIVSNNMIFDVKDSGDDENKKGVVQKINISHTETFQANGTEIIGKEAVGMVTIYNNYNKNQPLVATTRLLATSGELFRIKNTVNIPAGGSEEVEIYADDPNPDMAIPPSRFTVPGLWAGLQDKIYAESKEDIVYQQKVEKFIKSDDVEIALTEMKKLIIEKAKKEVNEKYKDYSQILEKIDENSIVSSTDSEPGDITESFDIEVSADVVVVAFNEGEYAEKAEQKFIASLSITRELLSFDKDNIFYTLNNFNIDNGEATITATFEGKTGLRESSELLDKDKYIGLTKDQISAYLSGRDEIAGHEIIFFPSFKKSTKLIEKGRINIEIRK